MRFVAQAIPKKGWRIRDNLINRFWGQIYTECLYCLIDELNSKKDPKN